MKKFALCLCVCVQLLCDAVARHSLTLSSCAFAVLRGAVLLWETHLLGLETRKEQLEQQLDQLRASQQQRMQVNLRPHRPHHRQAGLATGSEPIGFVFP